MCLKKNRAVLYRAEANWFGGLFSFFFLFPAVPIAPLRMAICAGTDTNVYDYMWMDEYVSVLHLAFKKIYVIRRKYLSKNKCKWMRCDSIYALGSSGSSSTGNGNDRTRKIRSTNGCTFEQRKYSAQYNWIDDAFGFIKCLSFYKYLRQMWPICSLIHWSWCANDVRACSFNNNPNRCCVRPKVRYEFSMTRLSHRFYLICVHSICYTHK